MRPHLAFVLALAAAPPASALPPCPPGALGALAAPRGGPALAEAGWTTIRAAPTFLAHIAGMASDGEVVWIVEHTGRLHRYAGGRWERLGDLPGSEGDDSLVAPVGADEAWIRFGDRLWRWRAGEVAEVASPGAGIEGLIGAQGHAWILADGRVHRSGAGGWSSEAIDRRAIELVAIGGEPWAVDEDGALWRRGAGGWAIAHWPACGRGARLVGRAADDLYLVGGWRGVWHWDGASWNDIPWPRGHVPVGDALVTTRGLVVHADWQYDGQLLRWDGAHWESGRTPRGSGHLAPWGDGGFLLGQWRDLLASDGACAEVVTRVGRIREASAIAPGGELFFVGAGGARRGRDGAPLLAHGAGTAAVAWGSPAGTIWTAGGQLRRGDAQGGRAVGGFLVRTQWDEEERPDRARTIAGTADDDVWVGGAWGSIHHWDGERLVPRHEHGLLAFQGAERLPCLRLRFGGPGWEACFERRGLELDGGARLAVHDGALEIEQEGKAERLPPGGPRLLEPIAVKESEDVAWIVSWDGVVRTSRAGLLGVWERPMPLSQRSDLVWDGEGLLVGGNRIDRLVPPP